MKLNSLISLLAVPATWAAYMPNMANAAKVSRSTQETDTSRLQYIPTSQKPRIYVMTDILNEPDDEQSMVRYLLYSNEVDTRGLCAITSTWLRDKAHPDAIRRIVNAYGEVVDNLNNHVHPLNQYSPADYLLSLITKGPDAYGKEALSMEPSEGALLLIQRLQESPEPLWVLAWGGTNTLAQALQHMDKTLSPSEAAVLRSRVRVYAISDQDNTGAWIRSKYPDIFYIVSVHALSHYALAAWVGMFNGLESFSIDKVEEPWVRENIQAFGPLGERYPDRVYGLEGDTPSFLYLIPNGLGDPENPTFGSWGGRWSFITGEREDKQFGDALDTVYFGEDKSETSNHATIGRWRDHYQNDMATRMRWSVTSDFANATHPPVPVVNGTRGPAPLRLSVAPGSEVVLDAGASVDPDSPAGEGSANLSFKWYQYLESDYLADSSAPENRTLTLEGLSSNSNINASAETTASDAGFKGYASGDAVKVGIPDRDQAWEYHVILEVTSSSQGNGDEQLPVRRYLRVLLLASRDGGAHPDECCRAMDVPPPKQTDW